MEKTGAVKHLLVDFGDHWELFIHFKLKTTYGNLKAIGTVPGASQNSLTLYCLKLTSVVDRYCFKYLPERMRNCSLEYVDSPEPDIRLLEPKKL